MSLMLACLAFALSQTVVAPALPDIQRAYHTDATSAAWILTGYLLSASVATPIVGKLGDVYGRGRVLTAVLLAFAAGSVVCALSGSLLVLILGRIIQGIGGGIFPLAFGTVRDLVPPERVATAIGWISATTGIGGGIGLVLAGVVVDVLSAPWLFWIGLISLPAAVAIWRYVPREPVRGDPGVDWLGAAVLSVALSALLYGLSRANDWGWGSTRALVLLLGGLALVAVWVRLQMRTARPLVEIRVLRHRPVLMTNITAVLVGFGMYALFLLVPQLAETPERFGYGFGASVTGSGLLMLPCTLVMLVAGPWAGRLAAISPRRPLVLGSLAMGVAFIVYAAAHGTEWELVIGGAVTGLGMGLAYASMANLVVASVPGDEVGIATGVNTIMRTLGGALGTTLVATLLTGKTIAATQMPADAAYTDAFAVAAVASLLAMLVALTIPQVRASGPEAAAAPATA